MTIRAQLKTIIDNYGTQDLTIAQLESLKQDLEAEVVQEISRRRLFITTIEDPRDAMRAQFAILSKALLADGIGVAQDGNSRKDKDGDVRWGIYKLSDPTDTATLKLGKDNTWAIVDAQTQKPGIGLMSLTDILKRKSPETKLDGWKLAK